MKEDLASKAVAGIGWTTVDKWGSSAIAFLVFVLLARLLDPVAFGLVALANVYLSFCALFSEQGFSAALIQRDEVTREHLDTAFWTTLAVGWVLVALTWILAGPVAAMFGEPRLQAVLTVLSFNFVATALSSVQIAILKRDFRFRLLAKRNVLATLIGGAVGVALAYRGYGVWSLVAMSLATSLVGLVVLWTASGWRPGFHFSMPHYRQLFAFGSSVVGTNLVKFLGRHADKMLIGLFLSTEAVGVYKIAFNLVNQLSSTLSTVYSVVALPLFSRLRDSRERLTGAFSMLTKVSLITAAPVFAILVIFADPIVPVVFGAQWLESVPLLRILGFAGLLYTVTYFNEPMLFALGKPGLQFSLTVLRAVTNAVLVLIAVQVSLPMVAFAIVASAYLTWPVTMKAISKYSGLPLAGYAQAVLRSLVPTACMALALLGFIHFAASPPRSLVILAAVGVAGGLHLWLLWYREETFLLTVLRLVQRSRALRGAAAPLSRAP